LLNLLIIVIVRVLPYGYYLRPDATAKPFEVKLRLQTKFENGRESRFFDDKAV